jgi:predicted small secreted protein
VRTRSCIWLTLALLVAAAAPMPSAFNARGAGEDLSAAGHGIEHAADHNTHY